MNQQLTTQTDMVPSAPVPLSPMELLSSAVERAAWRSTPSDDANVVRAFGESAAALIFGGILLMAML